MSQRRWDWPQEIRKVQQLPEGQVRPIIRPSVMERHAARSKPSFRENRTGMSPAHLELIRKLPCAVCPNRGRTEAHHLKSGAAVKERGVYLRATDRWAVPLCGWLHHREIERLGSRHEIDWFNRFGLDAHELANALWHSTGDLARMGAILVEHKQVAIRLLSLMAYGLTRAEAEEQIEARVGRQPS